MVSILEGEELGRVQTMLVDPDRGLVIGFILATKELDRGIRVAPYHKVSSFGSFALTVSRASDVTDLAGNPYFMELFERDAVLIGCKALEAGGKLVGYVQDVAIDSQDGTILLLKLSSDAGFMSPYRATIPFKAIGKIEADTVILKGEERVNFKKDTPGGEEGYSYVPLVVEESGLKDALEQRLLDEMEKVQRDAMKRLESEYERFFLKRHKDTLTRDIQDSLMELVKEKIQEALSAFRESILGDLQPMLGLLAPLGKLEAEAVAREREIESLREEISEAATTQAASVDSALEAISEDAQRRFSEIEAKYSRTLGERLLSLENMISARMKKQSEETRQGIAGSKSETEGELRAAVGKISAEIEEVGKSIAALAGRSAELERGLAEAAAQLPETAAEKIVLDDELRERLKEIEKGVADEIERRLGGLAAEMERKIEMAAGRMESLLGESDRRPNDAAGKLLAKLERLRETVESVAQEPPRMLSEFDARLSEAVDGLRENMQAAIDRVDEKTGRNLNRNLELEERVKDSLSEFMKQMRRGGVVDAEAIKALGEVWAAPEGMKAAEYQQSIDAMRALIEKQGGVIGALNEKISELETNLAAVPHPIEVPDVAAVIESHIESLRAEIEEKIRAASAVVGAASESVTDALKEQIQSGAWKQTIRESQIEFLRKVVEGERKSEGGEEDKAPVSDEDAIDVYGTGIAGSLMGKRVSRDIYAGADLIIQRGRVIDEGVIETAKVHGKFIELSLSVLEE